MANGYATEEFEVTEERLGVYRPEEHIDNPLGYADNLDARKFDPRLRGPVDNRELEIDARTGMKNYISNEAGGWATSAGYLRFSFARSIHFGRLYTSGGHGVSGKDADLCEALRCLGQALHCMEVRQPRLVGRVAVLTVSRTLARTATTASSPSLSWATTASSLTAATLPRST
jgi:hypothetical protein